MALPIIISYAALLTPNLIVASILPPAVKTETISPWSRYRGLEPGLIVMGVVSSGRSFLEIKNVSS